MTRDVVHAVIFDLDGVLVDSEELWDVVRRGVCRRSRPALAPGGDPSHAGHEYSRVVGVSD